MLEVVLAIVILSGVTVALARFGRRFQQLNTENQARTVASDLATARIEVVRNHTTYSTLVSTFNGTSETSATSANPSMAGYPGYTRTTAATRTQTTTNDFVTVTVSVTASGSILSSAVKKTVVISRF